MKFNYGLPLQSLTKKELEILHYVHDNSKDVESMSIQQFAKNINYSTSTVLRFCRKLGFSGYPELKYFLKQQEFSSPNDKEANINDISLTKIKTSILTDLEGTGGLLNADDLLVIVSILDKNETIYLHRPAGITDITVDYLESILFLAGFRNIYKSLSRRTTSHLIHTSDDKAIFIFISTSGSFSQTLDLAKEARLSGKIVISVSSVESNMLAEVSNYNLRFFSKTRENSGADFTSRLCTFFVLSTLIEYLSIKDTNSIEVADSFSDDINATIPENKQPLTETELLICDYCNEKINMLSQLSINDIASSLYVSPSSIVRFCQKAGFKGYNEFKYYLRNRNTYDYRNNSPFKVIQHSISIIKDLLDNISEDDIFKICDLIENCSSFYIYGRNMSSLPARYMHSMMTTMDIHCILIDWIDFLSGLSHTFSENTLLIMFTNYASLLNYSAIVEECRKNKVKIVWITSNEIDKRLVDPEDVYIYTNEDKLRDVNLRTKLSSFTIIQLIVEILIQRRFK